MASFARGRAALALLLASQALVPVEARDVDGFLAKSDVPKEPAELFRFHGGLSRGFHGGYHNSFQSGPHTYVHYQHETYGQTVSSAAGSAILGFFMVLLAFPCLYFNEKRQVHMESIFGYARNVMKTDLSSASVDAQYDANIVHMTGDTSCAEQLRDSDFGITLLNCAKLKRTVEMYQWVESSSTEERDAPGGGKDKITTYSYDMQWSSFWNDSSSFEEQGRGYDNPPMPVESKTESASDVGFGAFKLPGSLVCQMSDFQPLSAQERPGDMSAVGRQFRASGEYLTTQDGGPQVGDLRVQFEKLPCGPATVVSVQHSDSFVPLTYKMVPHSMCPLLASVPEKVPLPGGASEPFLDTSKPKRKPSFKESLLAPAGESLHQLAEGVVSADDMMDNAESAQACVHIAVRILGFFMLIVGFWAMLSFVPTLFRVIPLIGTWIQAFGNFFAFMASLLLSGFCWCLTVAVAWLVLRPVKGAAFLVVAFALVYLPTVMYGGAA